MASLHAKTYSTSKYSHAKCFSKQWNSIALIYLYSPTPAASSPSDANSYELFPPQSQYFRFAHGSAQLCFQFHIHDWLRYVGDIVVDVKFEIKFSQLNSFRLAFRIFLLYCEQFHCKRVSCCLRFYSCCYIVWQVNNKSSKILILESISRGIYC